MEHVRASLDSVFWSLAPASHGMNVCFCPMNPCGPSSWQGLVVIASKARASDSQIEVHTGRSLPPGRHRFFRSSHPCFTRTSPGLRDQKKVVHCGTEIFEPPKKGALERVGLSRTESSNMRIAPNPCDMGPPSLSADLSTVVAPRISRATTDDERPTATRLELIDNESIRC